MLVAMLDRVRVSARPLSPYKAAQENTCIPLLSLSLPTHTHMVSSTLASYSNSLEGRRFPCLSALHGHQSASY